MSAESAQGSLKEVGDVRPWDAIRGERRTPRAGGETVGDGSHPAVCCQEGGGRAGAPVAPKLGVENTPVADREACRWIRDRE